MALRNGKHQNCPSLFRFGPGQFMQMEFVLICIDGVAHIAITGVFMDFHLFGRHLCPARAQQYQCVNFSIGQHFQGIYLIACVRHTFWHFTMCFTFNGRYKYAICIDRRQYQSQTKNYYCNSYRFDCHIAWPRFRPYSVDCAVMSINKSENVADHITRCLGVVNWIGWDCCFTSVVPFRLIKWPVRNIEATLERHVRRGQQHLIAAILFEYMSSHTSSYTRM